MVTIDVNDVFYIYERVSPIWRQGPCLWVCNSHTLWSLLNRIQPYTSRTAAPTYLMGLPVYVDERADGLYFMPAKKVDTAMANITIALDIYQSRPWGTKYMTDILNKAGKGRWFYAPLGSPPPVNNVNYGKFVDPWPNVWSAVDSAPCRIDYHPNAGPVTDVGGIVYHHSGEYRMAGYGSAAYAQMTSNTWPPQNGILVPPPVGSQQRIMLGWDSSDGKMRVVAEQVIVTPTEAIIEGRRPFVMYTAITSPGDLIPASPPLSHLPPERQRAGAYRGWRKWNVKYNATRQPLLAGLAYKMEWQPGWNDAVGYNPLKSGGGGFYAVNSVEELVAQEPDIPSWLAGNHVYGSALLTGRMRPAKKGYRAMRAKAEYLILTGAMDTDLKLLAIADRYRMKVLDNIGSADALPTGLIEYVEEEEIL